MQGPGPTHSMDPSIATVHTPPYVSHTRTLHTHEHTFTCTCPTCTQTHACLHELTHVHMQAHATHMLTHARVHTCTHTCSPMHMYTHAHTHAHRHTCTDTRTHTQMCTHRHMHICSHTEAAHVHTHVPVHTAHKPLVTSSPHRVEPFLDPQPFHNLPQSPSPASLLSDAQHIADQLKSLSPEHTCLLTHPVPAMPSFPRIPPSPF
jgi:hypothetical protein